MPDGGEVALDWAEKDCSTTSPIVIILPGLTGASQAEYIKCLVSAAKKIGIRCVIFNNRGLGGVKLKVGDNETCHTASVNLNFLFDCFVTF